MRRSVAVVVLAALGAWACGGGASTTSAGSATTTVVATTAPSGSTLAEPASVDKPYGGSATIGLSEFVEEPPHLNMLLGSPFGGFSGLVFVGLVDNDPQTGSPFPKVAAEVPTLGNGGVALNEDGTMTVRYRLRDEAVWADGTPISGDDLAFTYATIMNPDLPIDEAIRAQHAKILPESVQAGPKTFQFTLGAPTIDFLELFVDIVPKHQVEGSDFANDWGDRPWISGGPFLFEEWKKGEYIRFVRNDRYWLTDPATGQAVPYLDGLELRYLAEEELVESLRSRDIDQLVLPPFRELIDEVAAFPGIRMLNVQTGIFEHLAFSFGPLRLERNPGSLNEHLLFRRAVAHAIDRARLVDAAFGELTDPIDSYVPLYSPTLSRSPWSRYDYDPDRARELLGELCTQLDRDCGVEVPRVVYSSNDLDYREQIGVELQEMLAEVGIEVELQLEESQIFFGPTLGSGSFDLAEFAWGVQPGLANLVFFHDVFDPHQTPTPEVLINPYRWGSSAVEVADDPATTDFDETVLNQGPSSVIDSHTARYAELYDQMLSTVDLDELSQLILEAEEILADQVVIIPLARRPFFVAEWPDQVESGEVAPSGIPFPELWYRTDL